MTIADLKPHQSGIIVRLRGAGYIRHRLLELGFTPRTKVTLQKVAPFGDPLELSIRGYEISILKKDAKLVLIEAIKNENRFNR